MLNFARSLYLPLIAVHICVCAPAQGQGKSSYKMDFVRAGWLHSADHDKVMAIFQVTPQTPEFRMVLSMRVAYDIGKGEVLVDMEKDRQARITVYGNDLEKKNKKLYEFVKDKVELNGPTPVYLLRIDILNPSTEKVEHMKVKYGLWEGAKAEIRNEQQYDFAVEDLNE